MFLQGISVKVFNERTSTEYKITQRGLLHSLRTSSAHMGRDIIAFKCVCVRLPMLSQNVRVWLRYKGRRLFNIKLTSLSVGLSARMGRCPGPRKPRSHAALRGEGTQ